MLHNSNHIFLLLPFSEIWGTWDDPCIQGTDRSVPWAGTVQEEQVWAAEATHKVSLATKRLKSPLSFLLCVGCNNSLFSNTVWGPVEPLVQCSCDTVSWHTSLSISEHCGAIVRATLRECDGHFVWQTHKCACSLCDFLSTLASLCTQESCYIGSWPDGCRNCSSLCGQGCEDHPERHHPASLE